MVHGQYLAYFFTKSLKNDIFGLYNEVPVNLIYDFDRNRSVPVIINMKIFEVFL